MHAAFEFQDRLQSLMILTRIFTKFLVFVVKCITNGKQFPQYVDLFLRDFQVQSE